MRNKRTKLSDHLITLLLLFFIGFSGVCYTQTSVPALEQRIRSQDLKKDFKILRENLENLHIGLYRYTPKQDFDKAFEQIESSLNEPMNAMEFFRKIAPLSKLIGNNHTGFSPPKTFLDAFRTKLPQFPLDVFWDGKSLYVLRNLSSNIYIKPGDEIKRINGTPSRVLFKELSNKIKRDGFNETYPNLRLSRYFAIHYAVLKEFTETYEIELKEPDGAKKKLKIAGLPAKQINENRLARYKEKKTLWENTDSPPLSLSIDGETAIMKIKTFEPSIISKNNQDGKNFFRESFKRLRQAKTKHLIMDLRNNSGGELALTRDLYSYFADKPFNFFKRINAKIDQLPNSPYITRNGSVERFNQIEWTKIGKVYELKDPSIFRKHNPAKRPFNGKLYVLTNAFSSSATATLLGMFKGENRAVFIGEESGGNPCEIVARESILLKLPNSKITAIIPLVLSVKNVNIENKGRGIIPDYSVKPTVQDILNGKDTVMGFALNLVNERSNTLSK